MTKNPDNRRHFVLTVRCETGPGIVSGVTSYLAEHGGNIVELAQFDDKITGQFFMRSVFNILPDSTCTFNQIRTGFIELADRLGLEWEMKEADRPTRVLIMVSRFDHCLLDLLYRHRKGELNIEIAAVVSNHLDLRPIVERDGIRFVYLPVTKQNKPAQEAELMKLVNETETELVILARYMQILSDPLCRQLHGRAINIHHSFLPGFKGAKPYHQAFDRGVKLIGATAHYVTADLDEGPIIEQSVQPVDHAYYPEELVALGRDTETSVLTRAVKLHAEQRIFLAGDKTVIFK
ncbi:formyltetrahydrofolate deformylase [Halomonas sp. SH5A2]|uniref:formyltetrahydrofolate deformylase n=1 Tax=Halomonas sp. SH5A2 TaxID=2749040 RepID=UPI001640326B|nr:formyltetrahydrofolate deformylase [Halomonas sp. SH5A2]QNI01927.1 formyltetrahydrofolate deformylase [Halomonas sp. SH5A2]